MNTTLSSRFSAIAFAALFTVAMLAGIDGLSHAPSHAPAQMAAAGSVSAV